MDFPFFMYFLSFFYLCPAFVACIIFLISKELLLTFLGRLSTGNEFHQFLFAQENLYFSLLLKDNFAGHRILDLSFFLSMFQICHFTLLACVKIQVKKSHM